jgi:hypothetical protein
MDGLVYFKTEGQVRSYAEKHGYNRGEIDYKIERANEGVEYYKQFSAIDGCEVAYVMDGGDIYMCFKWRGVFMRANVCYFFDEGTYELRLCEDMDWQGINGYSNSVSLGNVPQRVGKPTATKLDKWLEYLLDLRSRELENRERAFARMVEKIADVKKNFPEAKSVEWKNGYWCFEKVSNGLEYSVTIYSNGDIYENLELTTYQQDYLIGKAEKAKLMMNNGLKKVEPIDNGCKNSYQLKHQEYEEKLSKFIGKRPF